MYGPTDIHPKVAGATAGAAASSILVWVISLFGVEMPAAIAADFVIVGTFVAGWLTPEAL